MALTKLPKNAFGTGSIDASKIEDGTIQNVEIQGSITETQLSSTQNYSSKTVTLPNTSVTNDQLAGSIANAKLANSSFTVNGASGSLGGTLNIGTAFVADVSWQSVITADGSTTTTGVAGNGYFIDTTSNAHTFNLPASASIGDTIAIKDYAATFATNKLTISRNGHNIQGVANDSLISTNRASIVLVYVDSTKGWLYTDEHNVSSLLKAQFISATGGTVTTSGDYKIHTFTGDGCFVVTQLGNSPVVPTGGPTNVDYLVVAGGGGGAVNGGGGGAGGYRTTFPSPGSNAGSFPITATTYPITVGAGGSGKLTPGQGPASSGTPSIFSTITSAGGGGGAGCASQAFPPGSSKNGGSGGGIATSSPTAGAGNTPPVSPPQGNPGGGGNNGGAPWGSGGGATATGGSYPGGAGGAGAPNTITGSPVTYAGGGGGGTNISGTPVAGGAGGGGAGGTTSNMSGTPGTVNTGGGGGASGGCGSGTQQGGNGGKGIVIIRYKFQ